jgi:dTDP-4-amino-4,6-dideoxygalactose transaminase
MIYFNDLKSQWLEIKDSTMPEIAELFETSQFILGPQVERFENSFAKFCSCSYGVGVSNGTDAIKIAAKALELGESPRIFMPANTFVATWLAAREAYPNSEITMVDIDNHGQIDTANLELKIKEYRSQGGKDCLVIAVHMYGCCDTIDEISRIANNYNYRDGLYRCALLEDASQAHGAKSTRGTIAGSVGDIAAFSLYPGKNLGAAGDAGIITTNNEALAKKCKLLRNYGSEEKYIHKEIGYNHRLDSLQSIILYWKLKRLNEWNQSRSVSANTMRLALDNPEIEWMLTDNPSQAYHILPVLLENLEKRSAFMKYLNDNKVQCGIHYPVPIHKMSFYDKQEADLAKTENYANRMVSLPIHPFMMDIEIQYIVDTINKFRG